MLKVINGGVETVVEDWPGRIGYLDNGMAASGAFDNVALGFSNLLVGNPERAAGLEMTLQGPSLKFYGETWFAVTGADLAPRLDGSPISSWAAHRAPSGSVLTFGSRRSGVRAYLSVAGGFDVPVVMDSRSTYLLGRFGGLEGRPLKAQDRMPVGFEAQVRPPREGFVFPESLRPRIRKTRGCGRSWVLSRTFFPRKEWRRFFPRNT
jgi:urea carboxylase